MRLKEWLTALHYPTRSDDRTQPGKASPFWISALSPFALVYEQIVQSRLRVYQNGKLTAYEPTVPVISVGNLTTGGTGKTPIVIALAQGLIQAGKKVVVLSRGYGAKKPQAYARATHPDWGDEAAFIQAEVPEAIVIVGRDRVIALQKAVAEHAPDFVILDDGFQYLKMARHLNLLLIDGDALVGNGHLLPAGPLREPISALKRADAIFITKRITQETLETVQNWVHLYHEKKHLPILPVPFRPVSLKRASDGKLLPLDYLERAPVLAISGIAQPAAFEESLTFLNIQCFAKRRYSDHHNYTPKDVESLIAWRKRLTGSVLMPTTKVEQPLLTQIHLPGEASANTSNSTTLIQPIEIISPAPPEKPVFVTTDKDLVKLKTLFPVDLLNDVYSLQTLPAFDGRWFFDEFMTPFNQPVKSDEAPSADVRD